MSTRSMIFVTGLGTYGSTPTTYALYKHSDGYPTGNLPIIAKALKRCQAMVKHENERWKETDRFKLTPNTLVGKIIGYATSIYGMGAELEQTHSGPFQDKFVDHGDLEWVYIIDTDNHSVMVCGGGYGQNMCQPKNPLSYVKQLREECQESEAKAIQEGMDAIEALGYKINPKGRKVLCDK